VGSHEGEEDDLEREEVTLLLALALSLNAPPSLVDIAFEMAESGGISGFDLCVMIDCESQFEEEAIRREKDGTSYGLGQLYDKYHEQFRGDVILHLVETIRTFRDDCPGNCLSERVAHYNGGIYPKRAAKAWGRYVERRRDSKLLEVWRRVR
jgi:hypothetical protein